MNPSKTRDPRFWKKWKAAGAVGTVSRIIHTTANAVIEDENIAEARKWLGYARNSKSDNTSKIGWVRESLAKAGAGSDAIGTSEKELAELLVDGHIVEARKWLGYARNSKSDNTSEIRYIREYLAKAGAGSDAIGTSEDELADLLNAVAA